MLVGVDVGQQTEPGGRGDDHVKKSFHHIEALNGLAVFHEIASQLLGSLLRTLAGHLDKGENNECQVALKLAARLLYLYHFVGYLLSVKRLHSLLHGISYHILNLHTGMFISVLRVQR